VAQPGRIPPLVGDYALFLGLLLLRLLLDWARFPVDGYDRVTVPAVLESLIFYVALHYSVYLLLRANLVTVPRASRIALVTMTIYLFLHLLELVFPAGGRAQVYAPSDHLLANLLSAFLATGDAGYWQVMRLFVCGAVLFLYLLFQQGNWPRIVATMLVLYLWGMLLAHPGAWIFSPETFADLPEWVFQQGVQNFIISAWVLLLMTIAARLERHLACPDDALPPAYSLAWILGAVAVMFWQPMLIGTNSSQSFLTIQFVVILHFAAGTPRLQAVNAILVGDLARAAAVVLVSAALLHLWPLIGWPLLILLGWPLAEGVLAGPRWRQLPAMGFLTGICFSSFWAVASGVSPAAS
jgi:hypothetical protein